MTKQSETKPTLALALSGGAARCLAHIGVLEVFQDAGVRVDAVSGTSGGSIIGALFADGMTPDEMSELAARTGWAKLFKPVIPRTGLISSTGIHGFIKGHLKSRYIGDLPIPFAAVCADMASGEKVVLTHGELAKAVQASCSLPIIFTPTVMGGRTLMDGMFVSQTPVLAAREALGASVVIGVDVNHRTTDDPKLTSLPNIAMHLAHVVSRSYTISELSHADEVISVDMQGIFPYDIRKHKEIIERGRKAARAKMPAILKLLEKRG